MSITRAFYSAFKRKREKGWSCIYVAVDIHDTVFEATHDARAEEPFKWLGSSEKALQMMTERSDVKMILWTGTKPSDLSKYVAKFKESGICFDYIYENTDEGSTEIFDPRCKTYFNVGIDDKFGFNPTTDWDEVIRFLDSNQETV